LIIDSLPMLDIHVLRRRGLVALGAQAITLKIDGIAQPVTIALGWRPGTRKSRFRPPMTLYKRIPSLQSRDHFDRAREGVGTG
jgi:hypothetical protein